MSIREIYRKTTRIEDKVDTLLSLMQSAGIPEPQEGEIKPLISASFESRYAAGLAILRRCAEQYDANISSLPLLSHKGVTAFYPIAESDMDLLDALGWELVELPGGAYPSVGFVRLMVLMK